MLLPVFMRVSLLASRRYLFSSPRKLDGLLDVMLGIGYLGLSLGALIVHLIDCPFSYGNDRSHGDRSRTYVKD